MFYNLGTYRIYIQLAIQHPILTRFFFLIEIERVFLLLYVDFIAVFISLVAFYSIDIHQNNMHNLIAF